MFFLHGVDIGFFTQRPNKPVGFECVTIAHGTYWGQVGRGKGYLSQVRLSGCSGKTHLPDFPGHRVPPLVELPPKSGLKKSSSQICGPREIAQGLSHVQGMHGLAIIPYHPSILTELSAVLQA